MRQHPVALILAGGRSTRMGLDKRSLALGGGSLLEHAVALGQAVCGRAVLSGMTVPPDGLALDCLPDARPGMGPMGGVATALDALGEPVLALACDMPLLAEDALRTLLAVRAAAPASSLVTCYRHQGTGYLEPLCAVYEPGALPHLVRAMDSGRLGLGRAVPEALRSHVAVPAGMGGDFFNLNRPEDLKRLADADIGAGTSAGPRVAEGADGAHAPTTYGTYRAGKP